MLSHPSLTFRWSIWNINEWSLQMLQHSVSSFRRFFPDANYVVVSDNQSVKVDAELRPHTADFKTSVQDPHFLSIAFYNKYNPLRVTTSGIEIYVDIDIFCISEPTGIVKFISTNTYKTMLQTRTIGNTADRSGFGKWINMIHRDVPPCGAGFIGFNQDFNFQDRLRRAYKKSLALENHFFNEQGSIIYCLQKEILSGTALLLDEQYIRYFHPIAYPIDLKKHGTQMVHCIDSSRTNYSCFKELLNKKLI